MDNNRLELVLSIVDENTASATAKARANMRNFVEEAVKAAQGASNSLDRVTLDLAQSFEKASRGGISSLDRLEARAAAAGKSVRDKLIIQRDLGVKGFGGDEASVQRYVNAMTRLIDVEDAAERKRQTRASGIAAGKATLPGEAAFQDALRRVQVRDAGIAGIEGRARSATAAQLGPVERIRQERAGALEQFGQTESAARRITTAFNQIEAAEVNALRTERLERFKDGFLEFAVSAAAAGGVVKESLLDTATYAARTDTLRSASQQLAAANNLSVPAVERAVTLTKLKGITTQDALNTVNQMIVSGLDVTKAPELARVAQNQAPIAGSADGHTITSSEALSGIIHGIVERNIQDLRTYGIAINFQNVFDAFKKANPGKELSETQKTALALQAVLDFGAKTAGVYGATMETVGKQMSSLPRFALEAKNAVGEQLQPALSEGITVLTRFFMTIQEHGSAAAALASTVGTLITAFAAFRAVSFGAGLLGLGAIGGPLGLITAGLITLGGAFLLTTDKVKAQRDAIQLHVDQLNLQEENLKSAGLSLADYRREVELTDRALLAASLRQAKIDADDRRKGSDQVVGAMAGVPIMTRVPAQTYVGPDGKTYTVGQYESLNEHRNRNNTNTVNPKLSEEEKAAKDAAAIGDRSRASEDVLSAYKESLQLKSQIAQGQVSAQMKDLRSKIDQSKELTSPGDIETALGLTRVQNDLETQRRIDERRKRVDPKTGQLRDISGTAEFRQFEANEHANGNLRLQAETAKVLAEFRDMDNRYFQARTDADFKAWSEVQRRKLEAQQSLLQEIDHLESSTRDQYYQSESGNIDRQKELALQALSPVNAQTLREKQALEDQKFTIEAFYAQKSLTLQIQKINSERNSELSKIDRVAAVATLSPDDQSVIQAKRDANQLYDNEVSDALQASSQREILEAQKTANAKAQLQIESNKHVYESLKQDAAGLFDQLVFHTKSWGDFAKDLFKSTILTPVKEIFSSQVAALFTKGLTGQDVSFGEVGNGQGAFGRLGSIFGRAGLGQPRFGANQPLTKLDLPGHLGDVGLVQGGAVPVVIMNAPQVAQAHVQQARSSGLGSAAASLGFGGLLSGSAVAATTQAVRAPIETVTSFLRGGAIDGTTSGGIELPSAFGGSLGDSPWARALSDSLGSGASGSIFSLPTPPPFTEPPIDAGSLANVVGGTGNLSDSLFTQSLAQSLGAAHQGSGGILGQLSKNASGLLGNFKSMFGLDTSGTDLGGGIGIANTGILGHLAAFGKSGGAALLGGGIALDGIRRGGVLGTLEAAGGGALVGFKYGGPIGAVIGAAIGGGIAAGKSIFGTTDRQHAKDLVKQVYGMSINDATADQIVQIAKQSYGNQIDVAVRSSQVRDLLKLYAQATGQKSAEDQFVQSQVHSASFVESGGRLQQQAIYDNGNAYSYSSPLSVYGGVQTSPLSTYAPNQGVFNGNLQIHLNGQSASDALAGQVVRVATPSFVQGQALSASGSSIGRTAQQNMTLSPSALTR
jgi:hypothetical protein